MFGFLKKKIDKSARGKAINDKKLKHPERESESQLSDITTDMLKQYHRHIIESVDVIQTTNNPKTRHGKIDFCHTCYLSMLKLKPFCNQEQLAIIRDAEKTMKSIR